MKNQADVASLLPAPNHNHRKGNITMEQERPEVLPPPDTAFTPEQISIQGLVDAMDKYIFIKRKPEEEDE